MYFFFILSGFVIAFVVYDKKETPEKYIINRITRIYSVALPALLITVILYFLGNYINPNAFTALNEKLSSSSFILFTAITFLNQSWIATTTFSNLPYWSLGYEVLYYFFFGVMTYYSGKTRIIFLFLITLVMGPSILLYLPIWFMGVWCFKLVKKYRLNLKISISALIFSILGIIVTINPNNQTIINVHLESFLSDEFYKILLEPSENFGSDYVLAVFIAIHFVSIANLTNYISIIPEMFHKLIRQLSSHTFSIYLLHMPFLYFIFSLEQVLDNNFIYHFLLWFMTPIVLILISSFIENNKYILKNQLSFIIYRKREVD